MGSTPRVELFSITLNNKDIPSDDRYIEDTDAKKDDNNPIINFKDPFRIFIFDTTHVREIYNPVKVNEFFTPLPEQLLKKKNSDDDNIQNSLFKRLRDYDDDDDEEEFQDDTVLVLTGPDGDIVPWDIFDVIVHYDTRDREMDDSRLIEALPLYCYGKRGNLPVVVYTWWCRGCSRYYNRRTAFRAGGPFGSLTLDFIAYNDSRLVTLDVKWLLEDGIVDGVGGDEKINHATTTESSYICGDLSFRNSKYDDAISVLLKTPEDKAVKVAHGESIRLLKSKVAVPVCEFFTVEATLHDPITNSVVKGPVTFDFDLFSEENSYRMSKEIVGIGARIMVDVTMAPN